MKSPQHPLSEIISLRMIFRMVIVILFSLLLVDKSRAQCSSAGGTNAGSLTPATAWQTVTGVDRGEYFTFSGNSCNTYTFTFCSNGGTAGFDTQITITDNTTGATSYAYNDDFCSLSSEVTFTPTTTATYRVFVTRYSCQTGGAGTGATLAYRYTAANTTNSQYSLVDDATSVSPFNCVTLTPNSTNQRGCAWDVNSTLDFTAGFTYDFTVNLGSSDAGADGMSFTIQNDPRGRCACGTAGGSLGAGGITNSIMIEIDTYLNFEDRDDFTTSFIGCAGAEDPDHLDIWVNGTINPDLDGNCNATAGGERVITTAARLQNPPGVNYNIENGSNHLLRITWTPGSPGTLNATVMNMAATITYGTVAYSFNPMTVFGTNTPYFGFTASTGGLSNTQSMCEPSSLLPVEFTNLTAKCEDDGNKIEWSTLTETNSGHFLIEKSYNGNDYQVIGSIEAAGDSYEEKFYSFFDDASSKLVYYRIIQFDKNGQSKIYGPVSVNCGDDFELEVYPNPVNATEFTIALGDFRNLPENISIIDQTGKTVYTQNVSTSKFTFSPRDFAPGMYTVIVQKGSSFASKRFVITR
ncbi:MAG: lectin-like domain-containing protein [Bacteroidota bacterium]